MRARLTRRCRSTRGPWGQGSHCSMAAVPQTTTRARSARCAIAASLIAPAVLSKNMSMSSVQALSTGITHFDPDNGAEDVRYQKRILSDADAALAERLKLVKSTGDAPRKEFDAQRAG